MLLASGRWQCQAHSLATVIGSMFGEGSAANRNPYKSLDHQGGDEVLTPEQEQVERVAFRAAALEFCKQNSR